MQTDLLLGPCDSGDPMVLMMSGMENVAVWQALVRESQRKSLGFWRKAMPLAVENYMPFEK